MGKDYPTTHFDMDGVEAIGLVKMDILGQGGLAVMQEARESLRRRGLAVDFGALEANHPPSVNEPGPAFVPHGASIRVPVTRVKGLTERTTQSDCSPRKSTGGSLQ